MNNDAELPNMVDGDDFGPLGRFIRAFYDARRAGDPVSLRPFMAADIRWSEPDVGAHMGERRGRDAVLDMIRRALDTTDGERARTLSGALGRIGSD